MSGKISGFQWTVIILFFVILLIWLIALNFKSENAWTLNPWFSTMIAALLWGVWSEKSNYQITD